LYSFVHDFALRLLTGGEAGHISAPDEPSEDERVAENARRILTDNVVGIPLDEHQIVERITTAVMEQRLPASTKLSEARLCEAFGVGRMRVRRALLLLASQGIVDLHSNRGAFVACPDRKEAHDVFSARLALEPSIVRDVAANAAAADIKALEEHIGLEQQARAKRRRRDVIRLSGEFHVKLAQATGNGVLVRMIRELVARTSLIIGLFATTGAASCKEDEHLEILKALRDRDSSRAERLIRDHIAHIEADLDLSAGEPEEMDIGRILAEP
jgi:DNA-binding GntR family transcriptional regulator